MVKKCFVFSIVIFIFLVSITFAETQKSRLELDYGTSCKLAKFNQILNPNADKNLEPVYGYDGKAAENAMENYRKSFERTKEKPSYVFTIGATK